MVTLMRTFEVLKQYATVDNNMINHLVGIILYLIDYELYFS